MIAPETVCAGRVASPGRIVRYTVSTIEVTCAVTSMHILALTAVLALVSVLAAALPQDRAGAADDTIILRARVDGGNSVVTIERRYVEPWGWVAVGMFSKDDADAFSQGSMVLPVEFIPDFRLPLPPVDGFQTRYSGGYLPHVDECREIKYCAVVTCDWGFRVVLGPYYANMNRNTLTQLVWDGVWALSICPHGRLLREGALENPSGMVTIDEFRAMITAALARMGETRPIEAIPVMGTRENPFRSETTYVDIRIAWPSEHEEPPTVVVQARGGGAQQALDLDQSTTVGVYSILGW